MLGEREAIDLERSRQYIAAARSGKTMMVLDGATNYPLNIGDEMFGPYICTRCSSYLHKDSDHRSQYGEAPPR